MQDVYVGTAAAINFNNGIVRMLLADQDPSDLMTKGAKPEEMEARLKQQVLMPLPGFLYVFTIIKGLMDDPKMQKIIKKYTELGLLLSPLMRYRDEAIRER
ncbi:hypothetical protein [Roseibium litorale]|uniref:Uncharacterized protein n=1 Tax=Roseibium litorale TaxID=2803841 RepID=A0ABR9CNR3_9HYPH|nr:hypothetical protein [Roseibium litorale]MBD8892519.1 hypothetical protein [Roseibium litorale]